MIDPGVMLVANTPAPAICQLCQIYICLLQLKCFIVRDIFIGHPAYCMHSLDPVGLCPEELQSVDGLGVTGQNWYNSSLETTVSRADTAWYSTMTSHGSAYCQQTVSVVCSRL